jgi:hypothetical protein
LQTTTSARNILDHIEFTVEFTGKVGAVIEYYEAQINTKDYTHDCTYTGCVSTPNAKYWFIDASGTEWLQIQSFSFPAAFALYSITFAQTDPTDGAILAGLTLSTAAVPEISTWATMLLGFAGLGFAGYRGFQEEHDSIARGRALRRCDCQAGRDSRASA